MLTKFNLAEFQVMKLDEMQQAFGGQGTDVPNGGSECATGSGTKDIDNNGAIDCYKSDTTVFNGDGTSAGGEYHGVIWG